TSLLTTDFEVSMPCSLPANPRALWKQAPYPTANSCSGLVPPPGPPCSLGVRRLTSIDLSSVAPRPSRPPVISALAVYAIFSGVCICHLLFVGTIVTVDQLPPKVDNLLLALSCFAMLSRGFRR